MPKTLTFDPAKGCTIANSDATCIVDFETNEITLPDLFDEIFSGG